MYISFVDYVGLKTYNVYRYKQIMLPIDVIDRLKDLKKSDIDSFADILRRLLDAVKNPDIYQEVRIPNKGIDDLMKVGLFG